MREGGGGVERREWVFKNGGGGTARGSDSGLRVRRSRRVMAEIVNVLHNSIDDKNETYKIFFR